MLVSDEPWRKKGGKPSGRWERGGRQTTVLKGKYRGIGDRPSRTLKEMKKKKRGGIRSDEKRGGAKIKRGKKSRDMNGLFPGKGDEGGSGSGRRLGLEGIAEEGLAKRKSGNPAFP